MGETRLTQIINNIDEKIIRYLEDPQTYIDYREEFYLASNFRKRFPYPVHVDIELTNTCNYRCAFCEHGRSAETKKEYYRHKRELPKDIVFKILDECSRIGVKSIQLNVANEPLLCRHLIEVISYASALKFPDIFFMTNGSLLDREMSSKIIKSGLTKIMFSLDAFDAGVYSRIRRKSNYAEVVANILEFIKLKRELAANLPVVRVSCVVTDQNRHQIADFEKFWKEKVDFIAFQNFIDIDSGGSRNGGNPGSLSGYRCNMPYFRLTVKADGNVKPCCVFYGEDLNFGNIFSEDLITIWNKEEFRKFQELHKEHRWRENETCSNCIMHTNF